MEEQSPLRKLHLHVHHYLMLTFLAVALIAIVAGAYFYNQYNSLNNILKNPNVAVEKQTKQLTDQVGKLIMLPTDEQPTIATVTDASKLKDQPFFKNAVDGDKVLIYVKARKAILFDVAKNVIVDVAPVNLAQDNAAPSGTVAEPTTSASSPRADSGQAGQAIAPTSYVVPTAAVSPTPGK